MTSYYHFTYACKYCPLAEKRQLTSGHKLAVESRFVYKFFRVNSAKVLFVREIGKIDFLAFTNDRDDVITSAMLLEHYTRDDNSFSGL